MSKLTNVVENLHRYTKTETDIYDKIDIPVKYDLQAEQQYERIEEGFEVINYTKQNLLLLIKNPPYIYGFKDHNFNESYAKMVQEDKIRPFLLFINGRFIKWSSIQVYVDHYYTYFVIENGFEDIPTVDCILLPQDILYSEGYGAVRITRNTVFGFDYNGLLDSKFEKPYVTVESLSGYWEITNIKDDVRMQLAPKYRINPDNIFTFFENKLTRNVIVNRGLNVLHSDTENELYTIAFSNKNISGKCDNISRVKNPTLIGEKMLKSQTLSDKLQLLLEPFDFKMSKSMTYEENIKAAIAYIMSYNANLINSYYAKINPVEQLRYTGKQIKERAGADGYYSISKYFKGRLSNNVIVLKNGFLYEKYYMMYLERGKDYKIPVFNADIKDDDVFEIIYFTEVNNSEIEISLDSNTNGFITDLDPEINLKKAKIFTQESKENKFNIRHSQYIQYQIGFKGERIGKDKANIILDDPWYYDKDLSIISGTDFRYMHYVSDGNNQGIKLPLDFKYANDKSRYMVFVNNRRIDFENFKLTNIKNTRPFTHTCIYTNIELQENDMVDIFYLPISMEEILVDGEANHNIVAIDKSKIKYGYDENIYLTFINGRKVTPNQIYAVSSQKMLIVNAESGSNITIIKYIPDNEILSSIFTTNNEDKLSQSVNNMINTVFDSLYNNKDGLFTDSGLNRNLIYNDRIIYQIIRDFYKKPYITDDSAFEYDYEITNDKVVDSNGVVLFDLNTPM